jgi:mRNA interferase YafQ
MIYEIAITKRYKTSLKRVSQHRNFSRAELDKVVTLLCEGKKLPAKYKDHQLSGTLIDYRECHIKNDLLLMYQIDNNVLVLVLVDIGNHSTLFR